MTLFTLISCMSVEANFGLMIYNPLIFSFLYILVLQCMEYISIFSVFYLLKFLVILFFFYFSSF